MNSSMRAMVLGVVVLGGSLLACKGLAKKAGEEASKAAANAAASAKGLSPEEQADEDTLTKLSEYITCTNSMPKQVGASYRRYASWIPGKKQPDGKYIVSNDTPPTGKERNVYGLYEIHNVDQCKNALKKAKTMKPALADIDKAAADFESALDNVTPAVKKAYDYYEAKKYEDDKFAGAIEMHKPLVDAFDAFFEKSNAFSKLVGEKNIALQRKNLNTIERLYGKKFSWHKASIMLKSRDVIDELTAKYNKAVETKTDLPQEDIDAMGKLIDTLEAAVGELTAYAAKATDKPILYSMFEGDLKKYVNASRAYWRKKRDKQKFSAFDQRRINMGFGAQVEGSYDAVVAAFNDLIQRSNTMR